LREVLKKVSY